MARSPWVRTWPGPSSQGSPTRGTTTPGTRAAPAPASSSRSPGSPNFRRLLGTRLLGQAGDGALQTGLASFVLFSPERQSTPGAVAASFAILLLPYSLLGPFVGVFIDRWSRRQTLVLANVVRAALAVGVAAVLAASVSGWRLGLAALVVIAVNRFVLTALSAALPSSVPGHQLVTANAFAPTLGTFALVVGGGLALALRLALGDGDPAAGAVLLLAATLYLLASQAARGPPPRCSGRTSRCSCAWPTPWARPARPDRRAAPRLRPTPGGGRVPPDGRASGGVRPADRAGPLLLRTYFTTRRMSTPGCPGSGWRRSPPGSGR